MTALVHLTIGTEDLRTEPRMGGGFTILVGPPGAAQKISFTSAHAAELFAQAATLGAVTHGPFGEALRASTHRHKPPRLALVTANSDQPEPPKPAA